MGETKSSEQNTKIIIAAISVADFLYFKYFGICPLAAKVYKYVRLGNISLRFWRVLSVWIQHFKCQRSRTLYQKHTLSKQGL